VTNWQATVPLPLGTNHLTFVASDRATNVLATASITVTTTATGGGLDTDLDGMPDVWELANGLNPLVDDANLDQDGDGFSNLQEYLAGTDPSDSRSFLRLDVTTGSGEVRLTFVAVAGRSYSVLYCDDLGSGTWSKLTDAAAQGTNRTIKVRVSQPAPSPQKFFRLLTPRQP